MSGYPGRGRHWPADQQLVPPGRDGPSAATAYHLQEHRPETLVEAEVDAEVDGRVGDDEGVADPAEIELDSSI
jgi:hypothetical protein